MTYVYTENYQDGYAGIATPVERGAIYEWICYAILDRFKELKDDPRAIIYQGEVYLNLLHINNRWTAYMHGCSKPRSCQVIYNLLSLRGENPPVQGYQLGQHDPIEGRVYYKISRRYLSRVAEEVGIYPELLKSLAKDFDDKPNGEKYKD